MMLTDAFPEWIRKMCDSPLGVTGTIAALNTLATNADTSDATATYTSYANSLASWTVTIPDQPSNAVLSPITPLPLGGL